MTEILKETLAENEVRTHWAFINGWKVEPQASDRTPMVGELPIPPASAAAMRSSTRRKRQVMFKEWSQSRHD